MLIKVMKKNLYNLSKIFILKYRGVEKEVWGSG